MAFVDWHFFVDSGILCGKEQKGGNIFLVPLWNSLGLVEKAFCEKSDIRHKDSSIVPAHCFGLRYCYGEIDFTFRRTDCKNQCLMAVP